MDVDGFDGFPGFLDEELEDLRIDPGTLVRDHRALRRRQAGRRRRRFNSGRPFDDEGGGQVHRCQDVVQPRTGAGCWQDERIQAPGCVVEHPVGCPATGLEGLHVVLQAHDRIGQAFERNPCLVPTAPLHHLAGSHRDPFGNASRLVFLDHEQCGGDAAEQVRNGVQRGTIAGPLGNQRDGFLHPRKVGEALPHHDLGHGNPFRVFPIGGIRRRPGAIWHDQPDELLLEPVLHLEQRRGHGHQSRLVRLLVAANEILEVGTAGLDNLPQVAQAQHAQGVADLLQQLHLRSQLLNAFHAGTHIDVQHVLDAGEVIPDRRGNRLHQLDGGCGEALARLLDLLVAGDQTREIEGRADGADPRTIAGGPGHVVEEVVHQVGGRLRRELALTKGVQAFHLPVGLADEALDGDPGLQAAIGECLKNAAGHPPQLMHHIAGSGTLEAANHLLQAGHGVGAAIAPDPAKQGQLEPGTQGPGQRCHLLAGGGPGRCGPGRSPAVEGASAGLAVRTRSHIQQQQRALGQQGTTPGRPQVVEQRQQHQRDIASAVAEPFHIGRQLDSGAGECLDDVRGRPVPPDLQQVAAGLLHLLGQQARAPGLGDL